MHHHNTVTAILHLKLWVTICFLYLIMIVAIILCITLDIIVCVLPHHKLIFRFLIYYIAFRSINLENTKAISINCGWELRSRALKARLITNFYVFKVNFLFYQITERLLLLLLRILLHVSIESRVKIHYLWLSLERTRIPKVTWTTIALISKLFHLLLRWILCHMMRTGIPSCPWLLCWVTSSPWFFEYFTWLTYFWLRSPINARILMIVDLLNSTIFGNIALRFTTSNSHWGVFARSCLIRWRLNNIISSWNISIILILSRLALL